MAKSVQDTRDREASAMPRWVKVMGIGIGVIVLAVIVMAIAGVGGSHGPGRHLPSGDTTGATLGRSAGDEAPGHDPPTGTHP